MEGRDIDTGRLRTHCWVWGPEAGTPVLAGARPSRLELVRKAVAERLPSGARVVAPDLGGFGRTEPREIDATRGLRDWSGDPAALVSALGGSDSTGARGRLVAR